MGSFAPPETPAKQAREASHNGMGRPLKQPDERRGERLPGLRLTTAEREFIEAQAAAAGLSVADYARRRLLGRTVTPRRTAADDRALVELNRVGVNLNQIAARVNFTGELAEDFRAALDEIRAAVAKVAADGS